MNHSTEVAIIGGGQAGLAMSACLRAAGIEHVVIERGRIGERWRSERWPSLRLLTPNWMTRLPGLAQRHVDPEGFMTSSDFVRLLEGHARRIDAPALEGTSVIALEAADVGYRLETTSGTILARAVVIATGACDRPARPAWADRLPDSIAQITPDRYRDPRALAPRVLVVGASATGVQLAREIRRSGREVTLAAGRHVRVPRRYRGRDLFRWLDACGFLADAVPADAEADQLRAQPSLQLIGSHDDADVGLAALAMEGVRIVGRAVGASGTKIHLADSLAADCAAAEARRRKLLRRIDSYIVLSGFDVALDAEAWAPPAQLPPAPSEMDLQAEGIGAVVWATGYRRSYTWLKLPIVGANSELFARDGRTPAPGVFTLGLPFQRHRASAFIDGVGRDAEALLPAIANQLAGAIRRAA